MTPSSKLKNGLYLHGCLYSLVPSVRFELTLDGF